MLSGMDLDELIERAQETTGAEGDALKAELARRFREGDGVARDEEEATYWESGMTGSLQLESKKENDSTPKENDNASAKLAASEDYYRSLSEEDLFQAYREHIPWAEFLFACRMQESGDEAAAFDDLLNLSKELENKYSGGDQSSDTISLLAKVKQACGAAYENGKGTEQDYQRACSFYDQAMELGCRDAISSLLRCYDSLGILESNWDTVVVLLRKLEDGNEWEKLLAANTYCRLKKFTYAAVNYEAIAYGSFADPLVRTNALLGLCSLGRITEDELTVMARAGNASAACAAVQPFARKQNYSAAEEMLSICSERDMHLYSVALSTYNTIRANHQRLADEEAKKQDDLRRAEEQRRIARKQYLREEKKQERKDRREEYFSRAKPFLLLGAIGLGVVFVVSLFSQTNPFSKEGDLLPLFFFFVPYGWAILTRIFGRIDFPESTTGCLVVFFLFFVKLSISIPLGVIGFLYYLIHIFLD